MSFVYSSNVIYSKCYTEDRGSDGIFIEPTNLDLFDNSQLHPSNLGEEIPESCINYYRDPVWIGSDIYTRDPDYPEAVQRMAPITLAGNVTSSSLNSTRIILEDVKTGEELDLEAILSELSQLDYVETLPPTTISRVNFNNILHQDIGAGLALKKWTPEVAKRVEPMSAADDSTFDKWLLLPETDGRTIEEFADYSTEFQKLPTNEKIKLELIEKIQIAFVFTAFGVCPILLVMLGILQILK